MSKRDLSGTDKVPKGEPEPPNTGSPPARRADNRVLKGEPEPPDVGDSPASLQRRAPDSDSELDVQAYQQAQAFCETEPPGIEPDEPWQQPWEKNKNNPS